jgi:CRISPR-associated protein Cmr4
MKIELYTIKCLTNLHVGSGDINFDVIDNQVQRDSITNLPHINSSSLKGAFREHFSNIDETKGMVEYIFGPQNSSDDSHQTGAYSFFEAQLLTRPIRSNKKAYFNAIAPMVLKALLEKLENFNIEFDTTLKDELKKLVSIEPKDSALIFEDIKDVILEDEKASYYNFDTSKLKDFLGKDIALISDEMFKSLDLPVVARNQLDNGESKNLWYEEYIPKESRFFFFIAKPTNIDTKDYEQKIKGFNNRFENEGEIVQIGANKSIGYGFCKVAKGM